MTTSYCGDYGSMPLQQDVVAVALKKWIIRDRFSCIEKLTFMILLWDETFSVCPPHMLWHSIEATDQAATWKPALVPVPNKVETKQPTTYSFHTPAVLDDDDDGKVLSSIIRMFHCSIERPIMWLYENCLRRKDTLFPL